MLWSVKDVEIIQICKRRQFEMNLNRSARSSSAKHVVVVAMRSVRRFKVSQYNMRIFKQDMVA